MAIGCLEWYLVLVAVLLLIVGVLLMVELIIPGIAFLLYFCVKAMLRLALNDKRGCRGKHLLSLVLGTAWATVFTAPIAAAILLINLILASRH